MQNLFINLKRIYHSGNDNLSITIMRVFITMLLACLAMSCATTKLDSLEYVQIVIPGKSTAMDYAVYTPPQWKVGERLPLIVFLHGVGSSHQSFEQYGAHTYLNQMIRAGKLKRAIIIIPNGDNGMWENWQDGSHHYRDWVLDYIVPKVQSDYQTLGCPKHCHLAGVSVGGFGALRFAYFARDQFSSVSAMSAPIFNSGQSGKRSAPLLIRLFVPLDRIFGDAEKNEYRPSNPYNAWIDDLDQRRLRLQLIWGDQDKENIIQLNQQFHQRLIKHNVEHDHYIYSGGHKWRDWVPNFARIISFLLADEKPVTKG